MYKFLIFDWDGTLIDSAEGIINCFQKAADDLGYAVPTAEAVRNIIGLGMHEAVEAVIPDIDFDGINRMRQRYGHYYIDQGDSMAELFPGVADGLQRLHDAGYTLAVATGKSRRGLDRVFEETGIGHLFKHSRCADETRSKPHPRMLHELLQSSGLTPSQSLMVGDTEYDLEMAKKARVASVGVSYGSHSPERLQNHDPLTIINAFTEFEPWLAQSK